MSVISVLTDIKNFVTPSQSDIIRVTKNLGAASAYHATDVLSESTSAGQAWAFDFGFTGELDFAMVVSVTTAITPRLVLHLFSRIPTCTLNDHATSTSFIAADLLYMVGSVDFVAMTSVGAGMSYAIVTPGTYGNLPIKYRAKKLYGVLHTLDAFTQTAGGKMTIFLGARS